MELEDDPLNAQECGSTFYITSIGALVSYDPEDPPGEINLSADTLKKGAMKEEEEEEESIAAQKRKVKQVNFNRYMIYGSMSCFDVFNFLHCYIFINFRKAMAGQREADPVKEPAGESTMERTLMIQMRTGLTIKSMRPVRRKMREYQCSMKMKKKNQKGEEEG